ncbi:MAG: transposase [Anaerolineae bacterium]|nr:transposase [Anaerolineae bacterium]
MTTEIAVKTERVDDIPLLIMQIEHLDIDKVADRHCPVHGNWQGLSLGNTLKLWLAHVLSRGDHRLNRVQSWAGQRLATLQGCVGMAVVELDFTDDRLAAILDRLGDNPTWQAMEADMNQHLLRVYDIEPGSVRVDSTTVSGYWEVTAEGLFQYGPSKDHRPDLPQVKVMLSALDPMGLPLVTQVVSGQRADDPLYIPAIQQVRQSLQKTGLLYIGDVKMSAEKTRAFIVQAGDYYLSPLSQTQISLRAMEEILKPVLAGEQPLELIYGSAGEEAPARVAEGFEQSVDMQVGQGNARVQWSERRLIIHSIAQAERQQVVLDERLAKAEALLAKYNIHKQGKKRYTEIAVVQKKVHALLQRLQLVELFTLHYEMGEIQTPKGVSKPMVLVGFERNLTAIEQVKARMGWRVYATNRHSEQLSLADAVLAYRAEFLVERNFSRLKGRLLSIRPMYLADPQRVTGLVRLLALGLRVLTALEFTVRQGLAQEEATLAGVFKGNPTRATARPTAERCLEAFDNITLSIVTIGDQVHRHLTPLSELQIRILSLLHLSRNPYLAFLSFEPTLNISER